MRQAMILALACGLALAASGVRAQTAAGAATPAVAETAPQPGPASARAGMRDCQPGRGCVTGLPLPRYVSVKGAEARARRGPGGDHRVDWVYRRAGLPLKVTAEYFNWRRVEDAEGAGGWMHFGLLSSTRTVLVTEDMAPLRNSPDEGAAVVARAETGVVARVLACRPDWCRIRSEGLSGWVPKSALWGVEAGETFD
jgi:SH3-like domain-containing protein